ESLLRNRSCGGASRTACPLSKQPACHEGQYGTSHGCRASCGTGSRQGTAPGARFRRGVAPFRAGQGHEGRPADRAPSLRLEKRESYLVAGAAAAGLAGLIPTTALCSPLSSSRQTSVTLSPALWLARPVSALPWTGTVLLSGSPLMVR